MSTSGVPVSSVSDEAIDMSQPLKVYWAPGCTACLRMKEFLGKQGIAFESIDAAGDARGRDELATFGLRRVPVATRGLHWADGQVLKDVARLAGIRHAEAPRLPPAELHRRGLRVLDAALALAARIPADRLDTGLPGRQRTYRQLACHVVQIVEVFCDLVERGRRVEMADYLQPAPAHVDSVAALLDYARAVRDRFAAWGPRVADTDFDLAADVYYGKQTLHEFLERTAWHAAQHTRQLEAIVRSLGGSTEGALTPADLAGLPVPDHVYDDTVAIA